VKFKIDENLPKDVAEFLRSHGFDAETVSDERLAGADVYVQKRRTRSRLWKTTARTRRSGLSSPIELDIVDQTRSA